MCAAKFESGVIRDLCTTNYDRNEGVILQGKQTFRLNQPNSTKHLKHRSTVGMASMVPQHARILMVLNLEANLGAFEIKAKVIPVHTPASRFVRNKTAWTESTR